MEKIQRQPGGLSQLLLTFGGVTPAQLSDQAAGVLELVDFYAIPTREILSASGAPVEGTGIQVVTPNAWMLLYALEAQFTKTATMTALRGALAIARLTVDSIAVANEELGPFGATETGTARMSFVPARPWVLPPASRLIGVADILGTDATVALSVRAEVSRLA